MTAHEHNDAPRHKPHNATNGTFLTAAFNTEAVKSMAYLALEIAYTTEKAATSKTVNHFSRLEAINAALAEQVTDINQLIK